MIDRRCVLCVLEVWTGRRLLAHVVASDRFVVEGLEIDASDASLRRSRASRSDPHTLAGGPEAVRLAPPSRARIVAASIERVL